MTDKEWFNIKEAAEYLEVSRQTIYNLIEREVLRYYEVKGLRGKRIKKEDLDGLIQRSDKPGARTKK